MILPNDNRELLLVKRAREPSKDMWCLPVGFAESGESIQDAALRELREETGIDGKIIQIVDACSDHTDIYGDLLIVTFEAEKVRGTEAAGDDASDCGYFPVTNLPRLAFNSQEQAFRKFVSLKKDAWEINDSFQKLVEETEAGGPSGGERLLSDELIDLIEGAATQIVGFWISDISTNPSTRGYHGLGEQKLASSALYIIGQLGNWLKGGKSESDLKQFYLDLGRQRKREAIAVEEIRVPWSILKKHIFKFTSMADVWQNPSTCIACSSWESVSSTSLTGLPTIRWRDMVNDPAKRADASRAIS